MNNKALRRIGIITASVLLAGIIIVFLGIRFLNEHSIPSKEDRLHNLQVYSGITDLTELDESDIASDISAALSRFTNWDNLFLSEHFKEKFRNRKNILDDVWHIADISSGITYRDGEPVVIIFAEKKVPFFDSDASDNITTEYYFRYVLNDTGEIDDLILLEKRDVYTINGMPIDGSEEDEEE